MPGDYWDKTWNVVVGCDRVSAGCDLCFAIKSGRIRSANPNPAVAAAWDGTVTPAGRKMDWTGRVNEVDKRLDNPYGWRNPVRIYTTLVGDLFHAKVSLRFLVDTLARIATTGRHTYLNTTKRHGIMRSRMNDPELPQLVADRVIQLAGQRGVQQWDGVWPLTNLHLAVSVEDQSTARLRIPALLETPAAVRWISAEPLLRKVVLCTCRETPGQHPFLGAESCPLHGRVTLDWVVTGGESGSHRPSHTDWFRSLRDECVDAGTPFWFKQHGDYLNAEVFDAPGMAFGRAYRHPRGGLASPGINFPGPSGTMRNGTSRELRPGERTKGTVLLDENTIAVKVGAKAAGRDLDGRTWDQLPAVCHG